VTTQDGQEISGALVFQDEFALALRDSAGRYRSFEKLSVEFEVSNPLDAHIDQLARYTDDDIHDLITYLHMLR
jgi:hypothetical protein